MKEQHVQLVLASIICTLFLYNCVLLVYYTPTGVGITAPNGAGHVHTSFHDNVDVVEIANVMPALEEALAMAPGDALNLETTPGEQNVNLLWPGLMGDLLGPESVDPEEAPWMLSPVLCPSYVDSAAFATMFYGSTAPVRNVMQQPIRMLGYLPPLDCDVPCVGGDVSNADFRVFQGPNALHLAEDVTKDVIKVIYDPFPDPTSYTVNYDKVHAVADIASNLDPKSDVPLVPASWADFNLFQEPVEKTATALAALFMDNCETMPLNRLKQLQALMERIDVHAYGTCFHDDQSPELVHGYASPLMARVATMAKYKFTLIWETHDVEGFYSEQLFAALQAGSVPVVLAHEHVNTVVPYNSIVWVPSYDSMDELADTLTRLDGDSDTYASLLLWKEHGTLGAPEITPAWKVWLDQSVVTTVCRMCTQVAELLPQRYGVRMGPSLHAAADVERGRRAPCGTPFVWVRQRHWYWWRKVFLKENTMKELREQIMTHVPWTSENSRMCSRQQKEKEIYRVYDWRRKTVFHDDGHLDEYMKSVEDKRIEVIFH